VRQQARRYSQWQQNEIMRQVDELIKMGVIVPCQSEWASNPVVTFKKDKTARVCIDYRDLNRVTKKDLYPMPNVQTLLDALHGSAIYTSLDLFSGYYNIMVAEEDQEKTAFIVPGGG
jgi:Reverse transcriptase (RNA-dependent DNA polymerase)